MSELLEVKRKPKASAVPEPWPSSLYARPRLPMAPSALDETFVAEDILEGCRAAIQQLGIDGLTSVGISSALRGEGRTTIAIGMALALAEYGVETVLLELDLAHPQLGHRLAIAKYPGLGDLAEGRTTLPETLQPLYAGLKVIPAGQVHGSIPHAISQLARNDVLSDITNQGHVVVADLPPLLGNSMGRQAAACMANLVLVVRAGVTPVRSIQEAVTGLATSPTVLLNGTHTHVPGWAARLSGI